MYRADLIAKALLDDNSPKPSSNGSDLRRGITVSKATKRQQLAGLEHLTKHGDSTDFLDFFNDKLDIRYQADFNKLVVLLRDHGISDQIILRTCVLANSSVLNEWKTLWGIETR